MNSQTRPSKLSFCLCCHASADETGFVMNVVIIGFIVFKELREEEGREGDNEAIMLEE